MHTSTLTVLSGASRGLGLSLARQALAAGHQLITLARSELQLDAPQGAHHHLQVDLASAEGAQEAAKAKHSRTQADILSASPAADWRPTREAGVDAWSASAQTWSAGVRIGCTGWPTADG